jgi:hypothetical protein
MWKGKGKHRGDRGASARPSKVEPERQPDVLKGWEGYWVALRNDQVVAAAHNPRELAAKLHEMGPGGKGAVARFVPLPSDVIQIGVG